MDTKTKSRVKTILSICIVIGIVLGGIRLAGFLQGNFFILPLAYGQSLTDLESELDTQMGYRGELVDYVTSHNMTLPPIINLNSIDILDLEGIVKEHMKDCKSGTHDLLVSLFNNDTEMDEKMKKELLGPLGDC